MSTKLGQEPAFATSALLSGVEYIYQSGMSKRFYAACFAMQGLISRKYDTSSDPKPLIEKSFEYADELLKQEIK